MLYSVTGDYKYIREIVRQTEISKIIFEKLLHAKKNGIVLDGAGTYGEYIFQDYSEITWSCICDSQEVKKKIFENTPVLKRREAVAKYPEAFLL